METREKTLISRIWNKWNKWSSPCVTPIPMLCLGMGVTQGEDPWETIKLIDDLGKSKLQSVKNYILLFPSSKNTVALMSILFIEQLGYTTISTSYSDYMTSDFLHYCIAIANKMQ